MNKAQTRNGKKKFRFSRFRKRKKTERDIRRFKNNLSKIKPQERLLKLRTCLDYKIANKQNYLERRRKKHFANGICQICEVNEAICQHHIIPVKNGGSNAHWNRVIICDECHSFLHPWLGFAEDIETRDALKRHEQLDKEIASIVGLFSQAK